MAISIDKKNAHPSFAASFPGDSKRDQPCNKMRWPIAELAHNLHHFPQRFDLMLRDEVANHVIEMERCRDGQRGNDDGNQPVKKQSADSQIKFPSSL